MQDPQQGQHLLVGGAQLYTYRVLATGGQGLLHRDALGNASANPSLIRPALARITASYSPVVELAQPGIDVAPQEPSPAGPAGAPATGTSRRRLEVPTTAPPAALPAR